MRWKKGLFNFCVFLAFLLLWQLIVVVFRVPNYIIPPPWGVAKALFAMLMGANNTYLHIYYTFTESILGFLLGSSLGLALGVLIKQFEFINRVFLPYIIAFQTLPKTAIAPMMLIWFGYGMSSKVMVAASIAFFPVLINTMVGIDSVDSKEYELMRSLGSTRWQMFSKLQFPSALPYIFAGLDMAIIYSFLGAIVGEFVGAQRGLGFALVQMNFNMNMEGSFAVFIILSVTGIFLHYLVNFFNRKVVFWQSSKNQFTGA